MNSAKPTVAFHWQRRRSLRSASVPIKAKAIVLLGAMVLAPSDFGANMLQLPVVTATTIDTKTNAAAENMGGGALGGDGGSSGLVAKQSKGKTIGLKGAAQNFVKDYFEEGLVQQHLQQPTMTCGDGNETCYDENYNPISCAPISEGGCPCPDGEEKCGAIIEYGYAGYCTKVCCKKFWEGEETCYDDNYEATSCALISEGGCPCPDGEEKCRANIQIGNAGYCTKVCCKEGEETCYDDDYEATSCALISEGGCPCRDGEEKCGANVENGDPGYCTSLCCDYNKGERYCYDKDYNEFCAVGSCPTSTSYDEQSNAIAALVQDKGSPAEIAYFHGLNMEQKKLESTGGGGSLAKFAFEQNVHSLLLRVLKENHAAKTEVSFMTF